MPRMLFHSEKINNVLVTINKLYPEGCEVSVHQTGGVVVKQFMQWDAAQKWVSNCVGNNTEFAKLKHKYF